MFCQEKFLVSCVVMVLSSSPLIGLVSHSSPYFDKKLTHLNEEWYLSCDGNDTQKCGIAVTVPCRTFSWLLKQFYNMSFGYNTSLQLSVFTNSNLGVTKELTKTYSWINNLTVEASIFPKSRNANISVNFKDLCQLSGNWNIHGLNLIMVNSISQELSITIKKAVGQKKSNFVLILNSTWGHLKVSPGHNVLVSNSNFKSGVSSKKTLIEVSNSSLTINESSFHNLRVQENPAIMKAIASHVVIENINCTNNVGAYGLFQVLNGSQFIMKQSVFLNNGNYLSFSIIVVKYGSQLDLFKCEFKRNYALYGACIYSDNNIKVAIKNCSFKNNNAVAGGTMFFVGHKKNNHCNNRGRGTDLTSMNALDCKLKQTKSNLQKPSSCENDEIKPTYFVIGCSFHGNKAGKGGAIYAQHTSLGISKSHFIGNMAVYGGALMVLDVTLNIGECKHVLNLAAVGGVLLVRKGSSVCVRSSKFHQPSAIPTGLLGSYICIQTNTTLTLFNSTFHAFKLFPANGQILSDGNNTIYIHNCSFVDDNQVPGFTVSLKIEAFSRLKATECFFKTDFGFATIALLAAGNSHVTFENCTFEKISGLGLSDKASAFVQDSIISNCISTLHGRSLVVMCNDCKLTVSNTSITDNVFLPNHNFLIVPSNAVVIFINVLYARNSMSAHILARSGGNICIKDSVFRENVIVGSGHQITSKGLMVTVQNEIKIHRTLFVNNSVNIPKASLFSIINGGLLVDSCIFICNFVHTYWITDMALFTVHNAYSCVFSNSNFENNTFLFVLLGLSNIRWMNNSFTVEQCEFSHNFNIILQVQNITNIFIYHSRFLQHAVVAAYNNFLVNTANVRLWNSSFYSTNKKKYQLVFWNKLYYPHDIELFTLNSTFTVENQTYLTNAANFQLYATVARLILNYGISRRTRQTETPFSSNVPVPCQLNKSVICLCYYNYTSYSNIYNCSHTSQTSLPSVVLNYTDSVLLQNNYIYNVSGYYHYIGRIRFLNLEYNRISSLPDQFLAQINSSKTLESLNLANNKLITLPRTIERLTNLRELWLAGNPFYCDCSMIWMIGWLNNFTTSTGKHVIVDFLDIKCKTGKMAGYPIYILNEVRLGCFPSQWTVWQKVGVGSASVISITIICALLILVVKRSREFKFMIYYYLRLDTIPKDDPQENLDNIEYDAFFCYSCEDFMWIREVFWKNDSNLFDIEREYGFKLLIHDRDFIAGRTIRANITDGIENSRRIIFIMSRNFLKSKWGMEEFRIADAEAVNGRKNFIVIVLKEELRKDEMTKELEIYMKTYTYIDATKSVTQVPKRLRFSMPHVPLRKLKKEKPDDPYPIFNFDELDSEDEVPDDRIHARMLNNDTDNEDTEETNLITKHVRADVHKAYGAIN